MLLFDLSKILFYVYVTRNDLNYIFLISNSTFCTIDNPESLMYRTWEKTSITDNRMISVERVSNLLLNTFSMRFKFSLLYTIQLIINK